MCSFGFVICCGCLGGGNLFFLGVLEHRGWRFKSRRCLILLDKTIERTTKTVELMRKSCLENYVGEKERRDLSYQLQVAPSI